MRRLHEFMKGLAAKNVIPNRKAMQIYLQQCCAKSASFEAEQLCFAAARDAIEQMIACKCRFDIAVVLDIVLQASLRAELDGVLALADQLVKSLTHLTRNEQAFISEKIKFALVER